MRNRRMGRARVFNVGMLALPVIGTFGTTADLLGRMFNQCDGFPDPPADTSKCARCH